MDNQEVDRLLAYEDEPDLSEAGLPPASPLDCPDCGAGMTLLRGKFGLFYGCSKFEETGCKGSHTARNDGTPAGIPGNAETRRARREAIETIGRVGDRLRADQRASIIAKMGHGIASMNAEEAKHLARMYRHAVGEDTAWSRLLEDD